MLLGIDIGTSAVKAVLAGDDRLLAEVSVPLALSRPRPGWSEQAPADWWAAAQAAVAQLPGRIAVRAIGLSGQMHGLVALDARRQVIRPAILWNDSRAAVQAAALAAVPGLAERAGVTPLPGLTAPKVMWLRDEEPENHARIAHVLMPKDWLGLQLHGEISTDVSDAAGTLWLDQAARCWAPDLAALSATDPAWFPPVLDGAAEAGRLGAMAAAALGLTPGIPVIAGAGDTPAGAVGMGVVQPGRGLFGLGTSGQIVTVTDGYRGQPAGLVHDFAFPLPGLWYRMAAMLNGARPLAWFAQVAGRPLPELLAEAATVPPERVPLFLPYLTGERTPHGDADIRAAFFGLEDGSDAPAMMRAVVEAVAYSFADAAAALGRLPAEPLAVGGGARADLLLQSLADVLAVPVARPAEAAHGAAWGAARLAGLHVGALSDAELAQAPRIARTFVPDPSALPRHRARLARFQALYCAIRGL